MKKRIGSKLYDTDTAELINESIFGKIYRKRTRGREWFMVYNDPEKIEPLKDAEAHAMLGENTYHEKTPDYNYTYIRVDRDSHAIISKLASRENVSITEEVRRIVEKMKNSELQLEN